MTQASALIRAAWNKLGKNRLDTPKVSGLKIQTCVQQLLNGEMPQEPLMRELSRAEKAALMSALDAVSQRSMGLSTYLLFRGADGGLDVGHVRASQRSDQEIQKIRTALGYSSK